mgnify:FL=1
MRTRTDKLSKMMKESLYNNNKLPMILDVMGTIGRQKGYKKKHMVEMNIVLSCDMELPDRICKAGTTQKVIYFWEKRKNEIIYHYELITYDYDGNLNHTYLPEYEFENYCDIVYPN